MSIPTPLPGSPAPAPRRRRPVAAPILGYGLLRLRTELRNATILPH